MSYLLIQKYDPPTTAIQMHLAVLDEYLISGVPCVGNLSHPRHLLGRWVKVIAMHLKDMVRFFVLSFTFPYTSCVQCCHVTCYSCPGFTYKENVLFNLGVFNLYLY